MKKLEFSTHIQAPIHKVYELMLGLKDKAHYQHWTAAFNPTSTYDGSWDLGSKILFVGFDKDGKKGSMVSEVVAHEPAKLVSVRHYGFLDGDKDVTQGEIVEKWAGGHETYHYTIDGNTTKVRVELDTIDDFINYFQSTYPDALQRLKKLAEE